MMSYGISRRFDDGDDECLFAQPDERLGEAQISSGQYASSSDYIRDLIRRDQERKEKLRALQAAITLGLESGVAEGYDMAQIQRELDEEWDRSEVTRRCGLAKFLKAAGAHRGDAGGDRISGKCAP